MAEVRQGEMEKTSRRGQRLAWTAGIRATQRSRRLRVPGTPPRCVAVVARTQPHNRAVGRHGRRLGVAGYGRAVAFANRRLPRARRQLQPRPPEAARGCRCGAPRPRRAQHARGAPPPRGFGPRCRRISARGRLPRGAEGRQAGAAAGGWPGGCPLDAARSAPPPVPPRTTAAAVGARPSSRSTAKADERRVRFQWRPWRRGYVVPRLIFSDGPTYTARSRAKYFIGGERSVRAAEVTQPPAWRAAGDAPQG